MFEQQFRDVVEISGKQRVDNFQVFATSCKRALQNINVLCANPLELLNAGCDTVVLCQGSMARAMPALEGFPGRVLTSPYEAAEATKEKLKDRRKAK